jgi:hypothetical protein
MEVFVMSPTVNTLPTVTEYRRALEEAKRLREERRVFGELAGKKIQHLVYEEYGPRIRALETERDAAVSRQERDIEERHEWTEREIATRYTPTVGRVERILQLMRLSEECPDRVLPDTTVYTFHRGGSAPVEPLSLVQGGVVVTGPYLRMVAYIVPNKKPTNCYSLVLVITSFFRGRGDLELTRRIHTDFISGVHHERSELHVLKDGPDYDALVEYYGRLLARGLPPEIVEFMEDHTRLEQDFEIARGLFDDPEWLRLYLERMVRYYEHEYTRGTETAEYRAIRERLKTLG